MFRQGTPTSAKCYNFSKSLLGIETLDPRLQTQRCGVTISLNPY